MIKKYFPSSNIPPIDSMYEGLNIKGEPSYDYPIIFRISLDQRSKGS